MNFSLKLAINGFERAAKEFKKATAELNVEVQEEINRRNTVESLQELVESLPVSYIGCRRIYEKIERLIT